MLFVDAHQIHAHLDYLGLIEALRQLFIDGVDAIDRFSFTQTLPNGQQNSWILLPAWKFGKYQGIKLVSVYPNNEHKGIASVQGLYVLFDGTNGLPIASMDGAAITLRKTAANSALASAYLSRSDSEKLLMIGAGALAPHLIEAHCAVRPIKHVLIWNRTIERAQALVQQLQKLAVHVAIATDLTRALQEADIVSSATMTSEPIIRGKYVSPGTHLDLVGGYRPNMREADDDAIEKARIFVDARFSTIDECGDICTPLLAGLIKEEDVTDTFQLARGERPGRQTPDEITLFKSGGGGHEDLATACYLMQRLAVLKA